MRPRPIPIVFSIALTLALASGAQAQPLRPGQPVSRADASGTLAWLNVDKSELDHYDNWYNRSIYGGGEFGWYWTDNLKTEIDGGVSSKVEREVYRFESIGGRQIQTESTFHFATRRIAIGQQYQFYRNAWFHPFLGAGVDFTWETIEQEDGAISIFDTVTRQSTITREEVVRPEQTELHTRPFASIGFKTYMTPRSFFRSDLKFVFKSGVDEVLVRFGLGVDF